MFVRMRNEYGPPRDREQVLKEASVNFGQRVRELRKAAGLTQTELAERLGQWGRSYHQTTVAKLEKGTRPTTLDELIPLAAALGVSQREFFEDPTPADLAEHRVRETEQELLSIRSELGHVQARFVHLRGELEKTVELYSRRVAALREYDTAAAGERILAVEDLKEEIGTLQDISPAAMEEARLEAENLQDLSDTLDAERGPF